jgi:hypothetical protein
MNFIEQSHVVAEQPKRRVLVHTAFLPLRGIEFWADPAQIQRTAVFARFSGESKTISKKQVLSSHERDVNFLLIAFVSFKLRCFRSPLSWKQDFYLSPVNLDGRWLQGVTCKLRFFLK